MFINDMLLLIIIKNVQKKVVFVGLHSSVLNCILFSN